MRVALPCGCLFMVLFSVGFQYSHEMLEGQLAIFIISFGLTPNIEARF